MSKTSNVKKPAGAAAATVSATLPPEFVEYWQRLCIESPRRQVRVAHRRLIRDWMTGGKIPGYADGARNQLPRGWSYCNLLLLQPSYKTVKAKSLNAKVSAQPPGK